MATGSQVGAIGGYHSENNTQKNAKTAITERMTNNAARWALSKYANYCSTRSTWLEKASATLFIHVSQEKFIQVIDDDTLLESYSLADANFQWRVVRHEAKIVFIIKNREKESRKFRIRLAGVDDDVAAATAQSCVRYLGQYLLVHDVDDAGTRPPPWAATPVVPCLSIPQLVRVLTQSNQRAAHTSHGHSGDDLSDLVRSCLMDPSFPMLVEDVEKSLATLLKEAPDDDDDD